MNDRRHISRIGTEVHGESFKHAVRNGKQHEKPRKAQILRFENIKKPAAALKRNIAHARNERGDKGVIKHRGGNIGGAEVGGLFVADINKSFASHGRQQKPQGAAVGAGAAD